ncbi:MAG: zinc-ribbon domain containing protein [Patescibacteria group bacterium]
MENETKTCKSCKQNFIVTPDDVSFYEKMAVPAPEYCPECRQERRILFRNFKTLYKVDSAKSGKGVISMYPPDSPYQIYDHEEWWADDWDAKDYGRDFDFSRPFFEQLFDLWKAVPHYGLMNGYSENCVYSNMVWKSKNCYYVFGCIENEECDYGHLVWNSRDCVDNLYLNKCELCYECVDCIGCNRLLYSQESENCSDSIALFDCRGCTNCIGCVGLQQKSYHIYNKPVTKEEYEKFLKEHTIEEILAEREKLRLTLPHRSFYGYRNNGVSGNHLYNCKNVQQSFDIKMGGENSKFSYTVGTLFNSYDICFTPPNIEESYQAMACGYSKNLLVCHLCNTCSYASYSEHCYNSHNIFGCEGLKGSEYCILNKQYSKEEYEALKEKIITHMKSTGEWGKWFPINMSPFAYNESIVNEYSPLTKEQALAKGYRWKDDMPATHGQEHDDPDPMKRILKCDQCSRNYRFIERELVFYQKLNLPLPSKCFNCRHQRRMNLRLPRKLYDRHCAKCEKDIQTSYSPDHKEIIYCEQCYQQNVM